MFGFGGRRGGREARGQDIQVDVNLAFKEAVFGVERRLNCIKTIRVRNATVQAVQKEAR